MKELSIEEKAKAYDELMVKAQELTEDGYIDKLALWDLFPELKKSEDEKMKEAIIATIHLYYGEPLEDGAKEMIAWLEKQGEQKPTELDEDSYRVGVKRVLENPESYGLTKQKPALDIEIPFGAKDSELVGESITIPDGCYAIIDGNKVVIRKGEEPAEWSDEKEAARRLGSRW